MNHFTAPNQPEINGHSASQKGQKSSIFRSRRVLQLALRAECFLFFLFFLSCSGRRSEIDLERIQFLQHQLVQAERALLKDQEWVELLRTRLYEEELTFIEARISFFEENPPSALDPSLFLKDREILHRIIHKGPFAARATDLLDRILQLITQVSDANN